MVGELEAGSGGLAADTSVPLALKQRVNQRPGYHRRRGCGLREINITPAVRAKIGSKHGVTTDQVLAACTNVIRTAWHTDDRGRRLYLEGYTEENRILFVVLYPTARPGLWNVATARFLLTGV